MTLRHAATLALVGWYLMTPPPHPDPVTGLPNGVPNLSAPFEYWQNEGSFDSAKDCNSMLESNIQLSRQIEANVRSEHKSEQQELAEEDKSDHDAKLPKGWMRGMRHYGLTAAMSAQCIATDDPRLKGK
jgi:hypothetical protein